MLQKNTNSAHLMQALVMLVIYLVLYYFGGSARQLLYPIIWLVAFLHEMGHALGALVTGGEVVALQINPDGSGLTTTRGGSIGIILVGGYVGSALLGNILLYIGLKKRAWSQPALLALAGMMIFSFLKWSSTTNSGLLLLAYAVVLLFVAFKTTFDQHVVLFFGMASVLYVIQDFQVGPSSDLRAYEAHIGLFPSQIWMYIWLAIVVFITYSNISNLRLFGRR